MHSTSGQALSADDAAWFAERPHREFRCRHLTDAERAADADPYAHRGRPGLTRLCYVRRSDGATVNLWTPMPDFLIKEEDEGRARFAAQCLPEPPPLDVPVKHIDLDALAAPARASVQALADDALAQRVITAERHAEIVSDLSQHVRPSLVLQTADSGAQLCATVPIDPALLAELRLTGEQ
ncbi:hypothetical protein SAMN05216360_12535 [Methylobacterium phyllostachyos]|uniref:Uncharacterized protein n=1 Tax=Methylobacterium phyllostachyos TaxID=582672 RepID=A0A1H0K8A1_9HYPH|nr:hypothetical protein [Methylobacterium phyllostachyos]SDO52012.1 hypothetical protein SAMN05216360_12535 [Methylobacterium phyllostachyos]